MAQPKHSARTRARKLAAVHKGRLDEIHARLKQLGLSPRQFSRKFFRGEVSKDELWTTLEPLYGVKEMLRQQSRILAAQKRLNQRIWLIMKLREMEDRLEALGLPRD
jgi:hypothetical protein